MTDLFSEQKHYQPLAARVRPQNLSEYVGQSHLLGEGRPLAQALSRSALHSMILWGPPGVGKTTFARLLAQHFDVRFESLSAVLSGVKDIRAALDQAKLARQQQGRDTLLFVDEYSDVVVNAVGNILYVSPGFPHIFHVYD